MCVGIVVEHAARRQGALRGGIRSTNRQAQGHARHTIPAADGTTFAAQRVALIPSTHRAVRAARTIRGALRAKVDRRSARGSRARRYAGWLARRNTQLLGGGAVFSAHTPCATTYGLARAVLLWRTALAVVAARIRSWARGVGRRYMGRHTCGILGDAVRATRAFNNLVAHRIGTEAASEVLAASVVTARACNALRRVRLPHRHPHTTSTVLARMCTSV